MDYEKGKQLQWFYFYDTLGPNEVIILVWYLSALLDVASVGMVLMPFKTYLIIAITCLMLSLNSSANTMRTGILVYVLHLRIYGATSVFNI